MDKNLTDAEIVKALEICGTYKGKCTDCPAFVKVDRSNCKKVLLGAVEIINRQKAENERLEAECEEQYESAEATIRAEIASGGTSCHWCEDKVRIEAYKECIEKIQQMDVSMSDGYIAIKKNKFDNLLKELVGDKPPLNDVKCKNCEYLEFELPYAVCSKAYKGIVAPNDSCGKGKLKELVGDKP